MNSLREATVSLVAAAIEVRKHQLRVSLRLSRAIDSSRSDMSRSVELPRIDSATPSAEVRQYAP
jgi:hypothetical protein